MCAVSYGEKANRMLSTIKTPFRVIKRTYRKLYAHIYERRAKSKFRKNVRKFTRVIKKRGQRNIFDCFMLFEETELLHFRFLEYYDIVDYFVIVESKKTFKGNTHEPIFEKYREKFSRYLDKVIYILTDDLPENTNENIWIAESYQRNCIEKGLKQYAEPGDIILLSDIDEFWNRDAIKTIQDTAYPMVFEQDLFYYFVNCKKNIKWNGTCYAPFGFFSPQEMRDHARNCHSHKTIPDGGWHYSYQGGGDGYCQRWKTSTIHYS